MSRRRHNHPEVRVRFSCAQHGQLRDSVVLRGEALDVEGWDLHLSQRKSQRNGGDKITVSCPKCRQEGDRFTAQVRSERMLAYLIALKEAGTQRVTLQIDRAQRLLS